MNAINANPEQLASYAEITREYARFSRSAAGLGNVIGGVLALLSWAVWSYVPDSILRRGVLIVLPVLWIAIKKWLRRRYYQRYGQVTSRGDRRGKFWKVGLTALLALVSWGVVAAFIILGLRGPHHQPLVPARLLVDISLVPIAAWFFFDNWVELILGVGMVGTAVSGVYGEAPHGHEGGLLFLLVLALIWAGVREHRLYLSLEQKLKQTGQLV